MTLKPGSELTSSGFCCHDVFLFVGSVFICSPVLSASVRRGRQSRRGGVDASFSALDVVDMTWHQTHVAQDPPSAWGGPPQGVGVRQKDIKHMFARIQPLPMNVHPLAIIHTSALNMRITSRQGGNGARTQSEKRDRHHSLSYCACLFLFHPCSLSLLLSFFTVV